MSINTKLTKCMKSFLMSVLKYMTCDETYVFINNDYITKQNNVIPGFEFEPLMEGNGIKPEGRDEVFCLQYSTVFLLDPHIVKLRRGTKVEREIKVAEEACGYSWVAITSNEVLQAIAPICDEELDYCLFKKTLEQAKGQVTDYWYYTRIEDSLKLGEFLFEHRKKQ